MPYEGITIPIERRKKPTDLKSTAIDVKKPNPKPPRKRINRFICLFDIFNISTSKMGSKKQPNAINR